MIDTLSHCSFCNKHKDTVGKIIVSHAVAICNECVDLCNTLLNGSLCALGGMTPYPVLSALNHFPKDFGIDDNADAA